jgi:ubiquinone biosynthesis protein
VDELESAIRTVCEPIYNKPLKEISFAQVLLRLFETARRFDMRVQPQLILLQKTLFNIEGLGRQLYPELDLWKTAQPVLSEWMRERLRPRTILKQIRTHLPDALITLRQVPQILQTAVREAAEGTAPSVNTGMAQLRAELRWAASRRDTAIAAGVLWLSGLIWLVQTTQYPWFGGVQMIVAILLLVRVVSSRPRIE